ncbi:alpha-glutamyl/putrescinyl thymine pyrophosphorylase clade 3 protein [Arthrobacter sp. zg-Y750]|uniref:alpha-glutamyl/putrescinyl thymine pyrophosphorylase clade 3 protein n=1 Tax=Arthrobacter sp. zg-Y750 TaxID=2894189 RepID=UPI001E4238B4|nr:hypothetical protein [Arthrobacter sp. zg-Y750]MCC9178762.1 hypothetical protein [Arthrobacter sp. zg-Y750]
MNTASSAYRPRYQKRFDELTVKVGEFERQEKRLPGISDPIVRSVLINQLIDSERRNQYFDHIVSRPIDSDTANPHNEHFNPLKAAVYHWRAGATDEAFWLVFQYVHFGKHRIAGWRYVKEVYGRLGEHPIWSWAEISANTPEFRLWLGENQDHLTRKDGPRGFGNHRKYASLSHESPQGTASVFESYVDWIMTAQDHLHFFDSHCRGRTPIDAFEALYVAMGTVTNFGRVGKFDYLMTLSRLRFLDIRPGHAYLDKATGPLAGAHLLIEGTSSKPSAKSLSAVLIKFSQIVGVTPDVVEDAICNWQKSPDTFRSFVL